MWNTYSDPHRVFKSWPGISFHLTTSPWSPLVDTETQPGYSFRGKKLRSTLPPSFNGFYSESFRRLNSILFTYMKYRSELCTCINKSKKKTKESLNYYLNNRLKQVVTRLFHFNYPTQIKGKSRPPVHNVGLESFVLDNSLESLWHKPSLVQIVAICFPLRNVFHTVLKIET